MFTQPASGGPALPGDLSLTLPNGETIRHILLGDPGNIYQTMHLLHSLRYVETSQWSPLIQLPQGRLVITPVQGAQMSLLTRRV
ncbi:MAG: hypothetical protein AAFR99_17875 [Cyanobacteria bacterium J06629_9]